jgi:hypothetical protein
MFSNYFMADASPVTYTGQNAVQPVQNLLSNSGHCYLGSGILSLPEAIRKERGQQLGRHVINHGGNIIRCTRLLAN